MYVCKYVLIATSRGCQPASQPAWQEFKQWWCDYGRQTYLTAASKKKSTLFHIKNLDTICHPHKSYGKNAAWRFIHIKRSESRKYKIESNMNTVDNKNYNKM